MRMNRIVAAASGACALAGAITALPARAALSEADQAAIFKAAGFSQAADGRHIRCQEDPPTMSYTPGAIEEVDLNADGQPEAFVTEASMFCYGAPHTSFLAVARGPAGWTVLFEDVGMPVVLHARHGGWADVEVGGPGFDAMPVWRWNGAAYARITPGR